MSMGKDGGREKDRNYMGAVARCPCLACMVRGVFTWEVQVAHLRAGSEKHGKPYTAKGMKPSDCWTLPLCQPHHTGDARKVRETQHQMDEVEFWTNLGIDPFEACLQLNAAYDQGRSMPNTIARIAGEARSRLS